MSDLIDRQAAIEAITVELDRIDHVPQWVFDRLEKRLKQLPPAQPEQRTGKWIDGIIPNDSGGLPVIVCDQCNTFFPLQFGDGHNFCPNCGAKMTEGDAE